MGSYQIPPEWADYGARWGNDGLLYFAEWRRGFTVHELRAMFFDCQQVRALRQERDRAVTDLERAQIEVSQAEDRAAWYRRQLTLESRAGAMLARIAG